MLVGPLLRCPEVLYPWTWNIPTVNTYLGCPYTTIHHQLFPDKPQHHLSMSHSDTIKQATEPCQSIIPTDTAAPVGDSDPEKTVLAGDCNSSLGPAALEKWNQPSVNRNRYLATVFGLTVMGLNDACLGALIPYVRSLSLVQFTLISSISSAPWYDTYLAPHLGALNLGTTCTC